MCCMLENETECLMESLCFCATSVKVAHKHKMRTSLTKGSNGTSAKVLEQAITSFPPVLEVLHVLSNTEYAEPSQPEQESEVKLVK